MMRPVLLLVPLTVLLSAGCRRPGRAPRPVVAAPDRFRPPSLDLPRLAAPQPLPAARVVHLLFTSNVVGDLEPCG